MNTEQPEKLNGEPKQEFETNSNSSNSGEITSVYQQKVVEDVDLEKNIPNLNTGLGQRVNRKALIFIFLLLGMVLAFLAYAATLFSSGKKEDMEQQQREEVVSIPGAPVPAPITVSDMAATDTQQQPIGVNDGSSPPSAPQLTPPNINMSMPEVQTPQMPAFTDNAVTKNLDVEDLVSRRSSDGGDFIASENDKAQSENGVERLSAQKVLNPDYLLIQGTYIRCILSSRIVSDIPGNTSCVVTEPVYSSSGTKLLIPKGSKVLGSYASGSNVGDRVGVIWNRIITPNQVDIRMQSQGTDNLGGAGHPGYYKSHWQSRLGTALLISLIGDGVDYVGQKNMPDSVVTTNTSTTITPTETRTARTLERLAGEELNRLGMRQPTVTINQGQILNIFVSQDIDFEGVINN